MPFYPGAGAYRGKMKGVNPMVDSVQGHIETGGRFHTPRTLLKRRGKEGFRRWF
jgi:hypothetical protein